MRARAHATRGQQRHYLLKRTVAATRMTREGEMRHRHLKVLFVIAQSLAGAEFHLATPVRARAEVKAFSFVATAARGVRA